LPDPTNSAALVINLDPAELVDHIRCARRPSAWAQAFVEGSKRARAIAEREVDRGEAAIVHRVLRDAPRDAIVLFGNGLPIRHADLFAGGELADVAVLSQRGASGIDGLISGAAGAASAGGGRPVIAVVGDVSAIHDLGGLLVARTVSSPLVIVVINNDGGRIFEQLPIGAHPEIDRFTTPHGLELINAAPFFGIRTTAIENFAEAATTPGAILIESTVNPHDARDAYARIWRSTT
jgi:2-succinyl-5-enolpyruvyl-6-hydroxy-3-cyclohexene-1-carboxylate synthase